MATLCYTAVPPATPCPRLCGPGQTGCHWIAPSNADPRELTSGNPLFMLQDGWSPLGRGAARADQVPTTTASRVSGSVASLVRRSRRRLKGTLLHATGERSPRHARCPRLRGTISSDWQAGRPQPARHETVFHDGQAVHFRLACHRRRAIPVFRVSAADREANGKKRDSHVEKRAFWDRFPAEQRLKIFTGAIHVKALKREMIGDWDLRTVSELLSYLPSVREATAIELVTPIDSPERAYKRLEKGTWARGTRSGPSLSQSNVPYAEGAESSAGNMK